MEGSYFNDLDRFDSTPGVIRGGIMIAVSVERAVV